MFDEDEPAGQKEKQQVVDCRVLHHGFGRTLKYRREASASRVCGRTGCGQCSYYRLPTLRKQETGQEKRCLGRLDLLLLHKAENVESLNRAIGKEAVHRVLDVSVNLKHRAQFGDDQ